jgi:hypothetical protein
VKVGPLAKATASAITGIGGKCGATAMDSVELAFACAGTSKMADSTASTTQPHEARMVSIVYGFVAISYEGTHLNKTKDTQTNRHRKIKSTTKSRNTRSITTNEQTLHNTRSSNRREVLALVTTLPHHY